MPTPAILLIEDDPDDVDLLTGFLKKNGVEAALRVTWNADEAIASLESAHPAPALIILDLGLPSVSGQQVIQMIRSRPEWSAIPILVLTGSRRKADLDSCLALGVAAYFVKPGRWHEYHEFVRAVRRYVDAGADTDLSVGSDWGGKQAEDTRKREVDQALRELSFEDRQIVRLGLDQGYLKQQHILHALQEQRILADRGIEHSLWFLLQELAIITDADARKLRSLASSQSARALEIEGYVVQGKLGSGGMATVYRGKHDDGREVAIKILTPSLAQDTEFALRFKREVHAGSLLHHPHIARLLSSGDMDGLHYLLFELVPGNNLQAYVTEHGPIPEAATVQLLVQLAKALRYAWSHGVLHRDVKPSNILLGPARAGKHEPFCAKLCDFGLAKASSPDDAGVSSDLRHGSLTRSGIALGTPHYMSPEQASGAKSIDFRTDIYALAATMHFALTGKTIYTGENSVVIMRRRLESPVDLKRALQYGRPSIVTLLRSMLAKDRAERPSWDQILDHLRAHAPEIVAATDGDSGTTQALKAGPSAVTEAPLGPQRHHRRK